MISSSSRVIACTPSKPMLQKDIAALSVVSNLQVWPSRSFLCTNSLSDAPDVRGLAETWAPGKMIPQVRWSVTSHGKQAVAGTRLTWYTRRSLELSRHPHALPYSLCAKHPGRGLLLPRRVTTYIRYRTKLHARVVFNLGKHHGIDESSRRMPGPSLADRNAGLHRA